MINNVLTNSPTPPIIMIQGDHGPGAYLDWQSIPNSCVKERMAILNAYFLPEQHLNPALYDTITPRKLVSGYLEQLFWSQLNSFTRCKLFFFVGTTLPFHGCLATI